MLAPGVRLTEVTRGSIDRHQRWTLEVAITPGGGNPDPDAPAQTLVPHRVADRTAGRLRRLGFAARVEAVAEPADTDAPAGTLGWRVRVGWFARQSGATATLARLAAHGYPASAVYTGWDGTRDARGPWHLKILTIDPRRFRGTLASTYGPDFESRETVTALARADHAVAATNGGFFVLDPAAGAEGDLAGVGVWAGHFLSEPVGDRPALELHANGSATVARYTWSGWVRHERRTSRLDGIDRVPGLIRNCGGVGDQPTARPLQDFTCTRTNDLVEMTPQFGARTAAGAGAEVVLQARRVLAVHHTRGTTLRAGQTSLQGIGTFARMLGSWKVGDRVNVSTDLRRDGRTWHPSATTWVSNGGPALITNGRVDATIVRDGMLPADNPSFGYGWALKRNPRTFAGVDAQGRTLIVTVDGRTTSDLGLSITETAKVAHVLGLVDALNLDGGGSTAMAIDGYLISHPSDATGERAVGEALVVLPGRQAHRD